MFRQLFKRSQVVDRYVSSPLSKERLQYLAHWAEQGARNETLEKIARCQLVLVDLLDIESHPNRSFTVKEVEAAVDRLPKQAEMATPLNTPRHSLGTQWAG